jgi:quinol monooxygenase YgiN
MIHIIWEFKVNPSQAAAFEKIYGPQGAWAELFCESKEYHGTILMKDNASSDRYLTIDRWDNLKAFENFKAQHIKTYTDIDHKCEKLMLAERKVGVFEDI